MANDAYTLRLQQDVLVSRERALQYVQPNEIDRLNEVHLADLRKVSPDKLEPVLVKRNHDEWFAGFLVQSIGVGGMRLLIKDQTWRITRVKRTAKVIRVGEKNREQHARIVESQRVLRQEVADLLKGVPQCRTTRSRKGSKAEGKSKSQSVKGSSRKLS